MAATIYVEAQHDPLARQVILVATAENGDRRSIARPADTHDAAATELRAFVNVYRTAGADVVLRTGTRRAFPTV